LGDTAPLTARWDLSDLNNVLNSFGERSATGDTWPLDEAGEPSDLNNVLNNFGSVQYPAPPVNTNVPEPAGAMMAAVGAGLCMRRRRLVP